MLSTLSEKKMHVIRWGVFLAWALLIVSLFYDPISATLTNSNHSWSPLADSTMTLANDPDHCISAQGYCISLEPYPIGLRVFWGMVVPSTIFVVFVFGHEFWRRICPLYFFSQLPRALGMKPLLDIKQNAWLQNNHLYVQFVLFFSGITARILLINSVRPAAGVFFILTLLSAAVVVTLYGGRSWCHYICPFGMVQTVFTGPRGLLDSTARQAAPYSITQSMCRTVVSDQDRDGQAQEQSACVSCKSSCMDIDSEQAYWEQLHKPGRRLVQYGYLGLVIGYFAYYGLYAGNFNYYFSGVWSHESRAAIAMLDPGFYMAQHAIGIPKIIAAPLTLAAFAAASCWLCTQLERTYRGYLQQRSGSSSGNSSDNSSDNSPQLPADQGLHRMFSLCTFLAFNIFFIYGGRPEINRWPLAAQFGFQAIIGVLSSLWLARTWSRSRELYQKESMASKLKLQIKRQLSQSVLGLSNLSEMLSEPDLKQLNAEETSLLAKMLAQLVQVEQVNQVGARSQSTTADESFTIPQTVLKRNLSSTDSVNPILPTTRIRKR